MAKNWTIRDYAAGDETKIIELYKIVFGKELPLERWKWLYKSTSANSQFIAIAESVDGRIVGHYALIPVRVKIGDQKGIGTLSLDTMVHPEFRRQGMFVCLANYVYHNVSQQGGLFTYGFPNKNSYNGFVHALNWTSFDKGLPIVAKILDTDKTLSKAFKNNFWSGIAKKAIDTGLSAYYKFTIKSIPETCQIQQITSFEGWVNTVWEKASERLQITKIRDQQYLNWRYVDNPTSDYSLYAVEKSNNKIGYIVLKFEERFDLKVGYIVDMLVAQEEQKILQGMIAYATEVCRDNNVHIINSLMFHKPYLKAFRKNGFFTIPRKMYPQEIYSGVLCHQKKLAGVLTDSSNWFISWGDSDIV